MSPNLRWLLPLSLVGGILLYAFVRRGPPGLGDVAALTLVVLMLFALADDWRSLRTRLLAPVALALAADVALRASPVLAVFSGFAALVTVALMAGRAKIGGLRAIGPGEAAFELAAVLAWAVAGPLTALGHLPRLLPSSGRRGRLALRIGAGLVLSAPLLLIFGALFAAADAGFEALIREWLALDVREIVSTLFGSLALGWLLCGLLSRAFISTARWSAARPAGFIGVVELGVALGLLNLLFGLFVALQFRYLFSALPIGFNPNLNEFADYARRGFFELVVVAALVVGVLLAVDFAARTDEPRALRALHWLGALLAVLTFVIIASALQRMVRYTQAFGLTELRVYTTAFMLFTGGVLAWLIATVLRGRRQYFAAGVLALACTTLLALNAANVDDWIVRTNTALALDPPASVSQRYGGFDAAHAASLSADAVPALLDGLDQFAPRERCMIAQNLLDRRGSLATNDWRTWNLARWTAAQAIQQNAARLVAVPCS